MGEDAAPITVASDYMLVMETLMIFTPVRLFWDHRDHRLLNDTLFLKDGAILQQAAAAGKVVSGAEEGSWLRQVGDEFFRNTQQ